MKFTNFAKTTIANTALLVGDTGFGGVIGEGDRFPATGSGNIFKAVLFGAEFASPELDSSREIVEAYRSATNTFVIVRAQEGTTAKEWPVGTNFMHTVTAGTLDRYETHELTETTSAEDTDEFRLWDSLTSSFLKLTWANLKATLKTYFDTLYPPQGGWSSAGETWTYSSVDDPTGVITISGDKTTKYSVGMRIKFVNATNTIYGIITAVSYSDPNTSVTFLHEIDPTDSLALTFMANSAITAPYYSTQKVPFGFPLDHTKWTVKSIRSTDFTQASPTQNVWYNVMDITIPIGLWDVEYIGTFTGQRSSNADVFATLSTANNSESDAQFSIRVFTTNATSQSTTGRNKPIILSAEDVYYLNIKTSLDSETNIKAEGATGVPTTIKAICAYL